MTKRYVLRDDQWERIKKSLPGCEGHVGVTARDNLVFVQAMLYCTAIDQVFLGRIYLRASATFASCICAIRAGVGPVCGNASSKPWRKMGQ